MFVEPGEAVYEGMIVAENARDNDMEVNPTTAKRLSNMRTTSSDENIILKPANRMTLEQALEYIEDDELVEVTPKNIRLRKAVLSGSERKKVEENLLNRMGEIDKRLAAIQAQAPKK